MAGPKKSGSVPTIASIGARTPAQAGAIHSGFHGPKPCPMRGSDFHVQPCPSRRAAWKVK